MRLILVTAGVHQAFRNWLNSFRCQDSPEIGPGKAILLVFCYVIMKLFMESTYRENASRPFNHNLFGVLVILVIVSWNLLIYQFEASCFCCWVFTPVKNYCNRSKHGDQLDTVAQLSYHELILHLLCSHTSNFHIDLSSLSYQMTVTARN